MPLTRAISKPVTGCSKTAASGRPHRRLYSGPAASFRAPSESLYSTRYLSRPITNNHIAPWPYCIQDPQHLRAPSKQSRCLRLAPQTSRSPSEGHTLSRLSPTGQRTTGANGRPHLGLRRFCVWSPSWFRDPSECLHCLALSI